MQREITQLPVSGKAEIEKLIIIFGCITWLTAFFIMKSYQGKEETYLVQI